MKRRAKFLVGGLVILVALAYLIYAGVTQSLVYFVTPTELLAAPGYQELLKTLRGNQARQ
jgi:cytochrome c-type biogenesis protein CcmE